MPPKLYAARYDNDLTSPELFEFIEDPANVGIRWSIPFGFIRAEVTIKAKSRQDAYNRYNAHQGQRFAILDKPLDKPVCDGWIYEVRKDGLEVVYIIGGASTRHGDEYYLRGDMAASPGDTDAVIKDLLTDTVPAVSSDQSNIDATSTAVDQWEPDEYGGDLPKDVIQDLALMSDSGAAIWDYWVQSAPLETVTLGLPIPYLEKRVDTADADWVIREHDIGPGGARLARNIWKLKRKVTVYYGTVTGTHDGAGNSADLIDSGENFANEGVMPGDRILNTTDGSRGKVIEVTDDGAGNPGAKLVTELSGGTDDDWDNGDVAVIKMQTAGQVTSQATSTESDLWVTEFVSKQLNMTQTQAEQFRDMLLTQFEKAVTQQSFAITAPYITNGAGVRKPLWDVIKQNGGYLLADLFPAASLFSTSLDDRQALFIVALDYDYRSNRLRIVPDTEDTRLDVILKRAKLIDGEQIQAR